MQSWVSPAQPKDGNPTKEIQELRVRNAELQKAVEAVKEQLSKVSSKLGNNVKRKHSIENERLNRLQEEANHLQHEHAILTRKLREVDHVKELEKQLVSREAEVRQLAERNKFLQVEVRNNSKKLKQMASIEEQRAKLLASIKQERKVAQNALDKSQRDAELASQSKDSAQKRLRALESKDRLPQLKTEDVKQLIEMKQALAAKQETIEALQYRLSVLKRAHESVNRSLMSNPGDTTEIDALRAEIVELKTKLAQTSADSDHAAAEEYKQQPTPQPTASADRSRESSARPSARSDSKASSRAATVRDNNGDAKEAHKPDAQARTSPTVASDRLSGDSPVADSIGSSRHSATTAEAGVTNRHDASSVDSAPASQRSVASAADTASKPAMERPPSSPARGTTASDAAKSPSNASARSSEPEWLD